MLICKRSNTEFIVSFKGYTFICWYSSYSGCWFTDGLNNNYEMACEDFSVCLCDIYETFSLSFSYDEWCKM